MKWQSKIKLEEILIYIYIFETHNRGETKFALQWVAFLFQSLHCSLQIS